MNLGDDPRFSYSREAKAIAYRVFPLHVTAHHTLMFLDYNVFEKFDEPGVKLLAKLGDVRIFESKISD